MTSARLAATLGQRLADQVLTPASPDFRETATIFNQAFQHTPALIARCRDAEAVALAVKEATHHGVPLTVRSGGHAHGGQCVGEGALVIDTRALDSIEVAADGQSVTVGGGVLAGALLEHLTPLGRCTVTGFDARVGLGGLLLGGGYGLLSRRFGLACDQLLSAEVVLADGRIVEASPDEEPDLFWALQGAGANFGVVTRMTLRLYELPPIYGGTVFYHAGRADELLPRYVDFVSGLGDETTVYIGFETGPDRISTMSLIAFHVGDLEAGERVLKPLTSWGWPLNAELGEIDYPAIHQPGETFPEGFQHAWRAHFLPSLSPDTITTLHRALDAARGTTSWTVLEHMGGAIGARAATASAFPHRRAAFGLVNALRWQGAPPTERLEWQEALHEAVAPESIGTYVNYVSPRHGPEAVTRAYGANLRRLAELKHRYDPHRVFTGNVTLPAP